MSFVTARVGDIRAFEAQAILQRSKSVDLSQRGAGYRQVGWSSFDPMAPAYTADQVANERKHYPLL